MLKQAVKKKRTFVFCRACAQTAARRAGCAKKIRACALSARAHALTGDAMIHSASFLRGGSITACAGAGS